MRRNIVITDEVGAYVLSLGTIIGLKDSPEADPIVLVEDGYYRESYDLYSILKAVKEAGLALSLLSPEVRLQPESPNIHDGLLKGIAGARRTAVHMTYS